MEKENCCGSCAFRRTLKTSGGVVVAHKCIRNDEFITDFAHICDHFDEEKEQQKEARKE